MGRAPLGGCALEDSLDGLAAVAIAQGDAVRAARLLGAADVQWRASGAVRYAPDQPWYEHDLARRRAQLKQEAFRTPHAEGRGLEAHAAIAYALGEARPRIPPDA